MYRCLSSRAISSWAGASCHVVAQHNPGWHDTVIQKPHPSPEIPVTSRCFTAAKQLIVQSCGLVAPVTPAIAQFLGLIDADFPRIQHSLWVACRSRGGASANSFSMSKAFEERSVGAFEIRPRREEACIEPPCLLESTSQQHRVTYSRAFPAVCAPPAGGHRMVPL